MILPKQNLSWLVFYKHKRVSIVGRNGTLRKIGFNTAAQCYRHISKPTCFRPVAFSRSSLYKFLFPLQPPPFLNQTYTHTWMLMLLGYPRPIANEKKNCVSSRYNTNWNLQKIKIKTLFVHLKLNFPGLILLLYVNIVLFEFRKCSSFMLMKTNWYPSIFVHKKHSILKFRERKKYVERSCSIHKGNCGMIICYLWSTRTFHSR